MAHDFSLDCQESQGLKRRRKADNSLIRSNSSDASMSIFSHIKKSRQQAKEHNARLAEQKKRESAILPYKHVPTHAAADAIACAPPSWREQADRPKIVEHNRRRSAMAAAGYNMNTPGAPPRVGSSLSHVSYPSGDATPVVQMPRAYSYTNIHPYQGSRDVIYSMPDAAMSQPASWKGKDTYRGIYDTSSSSAPSKGTSHDRPSANRHSQYLFNLGDPSPEGSSSGSSSNDELEIKPTPPRVIPQGLPKSATTDTVSTAHRLHPSHRRNTSDSLDKIVLSSTVKPPTVRDSRPPPSTRGFQYVPSPGPVQAPPASRAPAFYPPTTQPSPMYYGDATKRNTELLSRQEATPSPQEMNTVPETRDENHTFTPSSTDAAEGSLNTVPLPSPSLDIGIPAESSISRYSTPTAMTNEKRRSQQLRQPELDRIDSGVEPSYFTHSHNRMSLQQMPPPLAHEDLVNVFPEPVTAPEGSQMSPTKKKKLSKAGGKLTKKNRWSLSKPYAIAA